MSTDLQTEVQKESQNVLILTGLLLKCEMCMNVDMSGTVFLTFIYIIMSYNLLYTFKHDASEKVEVSQQEGQTEIMDQQTSIHVQPVMLYWLCTETTLKNFLKMINRRLIL